MATLLDTPSPIVTGLDARVYLRQSRPDDAGEITKLFKTSKDLLHPWTVEPPDMGRYLATPHRMLVCRHADDAIIGQFSLGYIIRAGLQQAFLGYNVFTPYNRRGYMQEGMQLLLKYAFVILGLHRLEVNIQPENRPSIAFIKACGFRKEGYSPHYLDIDGTGFKDHERWAICTEDCDASLWGL